MASVDKVNYYEVLVDPYNMKIWNILLKLDKLYKNSADFHFFLWLWLSDKVG